MKMVTDKKNIFFALLFFFHPSISGASRARTFFKNLSKPKLVAVDPVKRLEILKHRYTNELAKAGSVEGALEQQEAKLNTIRARRSERKGFSGSFAKVSDDSQIRKVIRAKNELAEMQKIVEGQDKNSIFFPLSQTEIPLKKMTAIEKQHTLVDRLKRDIKQAQVNQVLDPSFTVIGSDIQRHYDEGIQKLMNQKIAAEAELKKLQSVQNKNVLPTIPAPSLNISPESFTQDLSTLEKNLKEIRQDMKKIRPRSDTI